KLRISEFFDIMVSYPDSLPAIDDLKECFKFENARNKLVISFRKALKKRLLQPAARTSDILDGYKSCIKIFQRLDPSGIVLDKIATPIRQYLRDREDTVKCILTSLLDETQGDLFEELGKGGEIEMDADDLHIDNFDDDNWQPDPIDITVDKKTKSHRSHDIISSLVNIFDTKDVFIKEYQNVLADRLLSLADYDDTKELEKLELLKLRFGESNMSICEVMIKDIKNSQRVDGHLHAEIPIHATILSRLFWPNFRTERLELPETIQGPLTTYRDAFAKYKQGQELHWLPHLGSVSVELELEDRTVEFNVPPMLASIVMLFQEHSTLTLNDIAQKLNLPDDVVRSRITYWIRHGILKETSTNTFVVLEQAESAAAIGTSPSDTPDDVGASSSIQTAEEKQAEDMSIYWSYIVGMLTNLGSLPIDRIHSMLSIFVQAPNKFNRSIEDLRDFLALMVREDKLDFSGGVYKLKIGGG
ncbi:hypothetical protein BKA69DRAFT_1030788, partial [Paraphysoderma sedebokerense]